MHELPPKPEKKQRGRRKQEVETRPESATEASKFECLIWRPRPKDKMPKEAAEAK